MRRGPDLTGELLARRLAAEGLEAYIEYMQLGFTPAAHHRLLIGELEAVERGEVRRLMVFMPPGSAKSTYASATFPAWYLGRHPENSIIACSHTQDLAERFGRRVRNHFASAAHGNVFGVGVSEDNQAAGRWETSRGGEYFASGVGGSITGRRSDLAIIDDPVAGREDADSERARGKAWDWYVNDFSPRLKPGGAQILIMTRWHEDDLAGRILDREAGSWRVVSLPMEAVPGDLLGRVAGERLWPEWFTDDQVDTAKLDVRSWNALYQQTPASEEGDYFKAEWFGEYEDLPEPRVMYGASDCAVTEGGGDYTEHGVFALDAWNNLYVADWWRGQKATAEWIDRLCDLIIRWEPDCWFGESGVIRRATEPQMLRRMEDREAFCRIEWLPSMAKKEARAKPFRDLASMGKVFFPRHARWKADLMGQLIRFPAGRFDDGVDVCSLIGRGMENLRAPRRLRRRLEEFGAVSHEIGEGQQDWLGV